MFGGLSRTAHVNNENFFATFLWMLLSPGRFAICWAHGLAVGIVRHADFTWCNLTGACQQVGFSLTGIFADCQTHFQMGSR